MSAGRTRKLRMTLRDKLPAKIRRTLSEHPVAAELHPDLNEGLTAEEIPYSWQEKVWWQCIKVPSHSWEATVNNRTKATRPSGCGPCRNKRLGRNVPFERSLEYRYPEIAKELIPDRSGFTASQVLYGSKDVAWWSCPEGHVDYDMPVNSRTNPGQRQGCPTCARKRLTPEFSLAYIAPPAAREFLSSVNGMTPEEIFSQDNRRYIWQCSTAPAHRWPASPNNRVGKNSGCPNCSGALVSDLNRLSDLRPDLARQWDKDRNGVLTPTDVSIGSSREVHWTCDQGDDHRWLAQVGKRSAGSGCPFCAGNRVSETTSLLALRPDLAAQLDSEASGVSAAELTIGSGRKVHWICPVSPVEHTWQAKVLNRTLNGTGCPDCNVPGTSAQEIRLAAELSTVLPVALNVHRLRTGLRYERVDILIPALSLALEFDGSYWHESTGEADAAKAQRLLTVVDHVVRVREQPLKRLDPVRDVTVPSQAPSHIAAGIVLDHLVGLGVIPASTVATYRSIPGPRAANLAEKTLADLRARAAARKKAKAQADGPDVNGQAIEKPNPPLTL